MVDNGFFVPMLSVAIGIAVLLALLFVVLRIRQRSHVVDADDALWRQRDYRCPACDAPLEPGYAMAGRGIIWQPKQRARSTTFSTITQALDNTISFGLPPATNMAWHCPECRIILIDHSKLIRQPKA